MGDKAGEGFSGLLRGVRKPRAMAIFASMEGCFVGIWPPLSSGQGERTCFHPKMYRRRAQGMPQAKHAGELHQGDRSMGMRGRRRGQERCAQRCSRRPGRVDCSGTLWEGRLPPCVRDILLREIRESWKWASLLSSCRNGRRKSLSYKSDAWETGSH